MFNVTPYHYANYDRKNTVLYIITSEIPDDATDDLEVQVRITTITPHDISIKCDVLELGDIKKDAGAIYGLDYYVELISALRKFGITVPRERIIDELYLAAYELANKLDEVGKDSLPIFASAQAHGVLYEGATYEHELKTIREILKKIHHPK